MRLALVGHALPQRSSNGGPMTCFALMAEALAQGHDVTVVALRFPDDPFAGEERAEELREEGAEVIAMDAGAPGRLSAPAGTVPLRGRPSLEQLFPAARLRPALREVLAGAAPDAVLAYHWEAVAATDGLDEAPRLGLVDDPWHLPNLRRWQRARPAPSRAYVYWTLSTLRGIRPSTRAMAGLLRRCAAAGSLQAQTAAWLRANGAPDCAYFAAPIPDAGGADWRERRADSRDGRLRILLGPSNLEATSTRAGLRLFAKEVLPALDRELGPDAFEVRVVGEGEPPPELVSREGIVVTGRIEPADDEFRSAHLQLVPTPFALGKRVRIIVAWSHGCPVVAHGAEVATLPELEPGVNALVGANGRELATAIARLARDEDLRRRLSEAGRRTYEEHFAPEVAARPILDRLRALAAREARAAR